jgi:nucleoside-diphosphate-sugar epimerase
MTRSIITGATGFVGANLARRLLAEGREVHLLVRPQYTAWRIREIERDVRLHVVDLEDTDSLARVVGSIRAESIFHLAAYGAYASQADIHRMVATNITGTINLVQACLKTGFEAFVNTGTSSEYGFKSLAPSEDEPLEPNSSYAVTKASATLFCRHIAETHSVNLSTLRLYSTYGPYEEPSRLMPALIMRGLEGALPPLANADAAHDFVYVDDVCDAYVLAARQKTAEHGAIYNVGTGKQTMLSEVVRLAQRLMAIQAEPIWNSMQDREWDTAVWVSNSEKIRRGLGWRPRHSFEQGFTETLGWFQSKPEILELYKRLSAG